MQDKITIAQNNLEEIEDLKQALDHGCGRTDVVMLAKGEVSDKNLKELNEVHQENSAWTTFRRGEKIEVISFYKRVFNLLTLKQEFLELTKSQSMEELIAVGVLYLASFHKYEIRSDWSPSCSFI